MAGKPPVTYTPKQLVKEFAAITTYYETLSDRIAVVEKRGLHVALNSKAIENAKIAIGTLSRDIGYQIEDADLGASGAA